MRSNFFLGPLLLSAQASAVSIADINGNKYLSPYSGQTVSDVTGTITAKSSNGIFIRSLNITSDRRVSDSLYLYGPQLGRNESLSLGDVITVSGKVTEYRSDPAFVPSTEIESVVITGLVKGGPLAQPVIIVKHTPFPPTEQFSSLDGGDVFAVPNNRSQISVVNPTLEPDNYGMDFWESLSGELITIEQPVAVSKPSNRGETWIVGNWPTTGKNSRGGLTLSDKDGNPEAIIVGSPLDGTKNSKKFKIGDKFADITGIVHYQFGFYFILPTTNLARVSSPTPDLPPPTSLLSDGTCSGLTFGDYNIENFVPGNTQHVKEVAAHIVNYMKTPDVLFVQEVQDNSGGTNDGVVDADVTLTTLVNAISAISPVTYSFTNVNPVNGEDGGQQGGNIRVAYLYKSDIVKLRSTNPGGPTDANEVLPGPTLKYNPGRIDPANPCWEASRKPLVAEWETLDGQSNFFTVNVHWSSKNGGSSLQGDARPPVNTPVEKRTQQANVTATFIAAILAQDPDASIIMAGDCNEFAVALPMLTFEAVSGMVDLDVAAGIEETERYTYSYVQDMQELDHMFVSPAIASKGVQGEHIHVNTWVNFDDQVSDHDPTVAMLNVCKPQASKGWQERVEL